MLTKLEPVFRSLKTDLDFRLVFHQIDRRVEGHLLISVLACHFVHTLRLSPNPYFMRATTSTRRAAPWHGPRIAAALVPGQGCVV